MRQLTNLEEAFHELNRLLNTAIIANKVEIFDTYPSDSSASLDAWLHGEPEESHQLIADHLGEWRQQCVDSGAAMTRIHAVDRVSVSSECSYLAHEIYVVYPFLRAGIEKIFLAPRIEKLRKLPGDFWLITLENHTIVFQWHYTDKGFLERGQLITDPKTVNWYQAVWRELFVARQVLPKP